jgi:hypothetical protein
MLGAHVGYWQILDSKCPGRFDPPAVWQHSFVNQQWGGRCPPCVRAAVPPRI